MAAAFQDGVLVVLKYIAAVSLTVVAWTPVALANDVSDAESARANARANATVSGSGRGEQRPKLKAQPRSYENERALKAKAVDRARAQAQAAAAARAKLNAAQPSKPGGGPIEPATATGARAAPKEDLQQTTGIAKSPTAPAQDAPAAATCRKYSPAVGGMVEAPC